MEMICIICPNSCNMDIEFDGETLLVSGAKCPKGKVYAETEMKNPKRSVASTVATIFADVPVVPVKTDGEIPKNLMLKLMDELRNIKLDKRVPQGYVVISNILQTGVDVVTTSNILQSKV